MGEPGQQMVGDLADLARSLSGANAPSDADAWLDSRDAPVFEEHWLRALGSVPDVTEPWVAEVRELAYLAVCRSTENPEIAAYVSDDLDLIGRFAVAGVADQWVQGLLAVYLAGDLPSGSVEPDPRSISSLLRDQDTTP